MFRIALAMLVGLFLVAGAADVLAKSSSGRSSGKSYSSKSYSGKLHSYRSTGRKSYGSSHSRSRSTGGGYGATNPRDHRVRGHFRKDGAYVAPHRSTNPNATQRDNYSTRGNVNPYTGKPGTKNADR